jgi:hypothetical protein
VNIEVGQKVKVTGTLDQYQGDMELRVIEVSVTDTSVNPVVPASVTTLEAMNSGNGGRLLSVEGTVTRMDSQNLYIDDGSGEARIFVDGYIGDGSGDASKLGKWDPDILVGDKVTAIGIASVDTAGPRLRVRNTAEIVRIKDTVPPVITVSGVEDGKFYNTDVTPSVTANEGTLTMTLNNNSYSGGAITEEGSYVLKIAAVDRDGNTAEQTISFIIDKTAPVISITGVGDGDKIKLNKSVVVSWSAQDALSGIDTAEGDIVSGGKLDTSTVGLHTLAFTATDKAGNITTKSVTYHVEYVFSGFLNPLNHQKTWKAGCTIPVIFSLKDANGFYVKNVKAKLYIAKVVNGTVGPEEKAYSHLGCILGNTFVYERLTRQYIFPLWTRFKSGTYQLRIDLGDGTVNTTRITLK